jgi:homocysteine S-methyltransferase
MDVFSAFLDRQGFVVLDGGLATELENRSESLKTPLWSAQILLVSPEKIAEIHNAYFVAGADIAITSSYQATFPGLRAIGLTSQQAEQVIRRSVAVATNARDLFWSEPRNRVGRVRPLIAASVGPYGAFLHDGSEYRGDYGVSCNTLKEFHRDRLEVLADSGADLIACESIPSLSEAQGLAELLDDFPKARAWISFTCKDEAHISDGSLFSDAIRAVCQSPAFVAVGLNCTAPRLVNALLEKAQDVTDKPLVVYPNSGELYDVATSGWRSTSEVATIAGAAREWHRRGALLIGGCCRTTPETIRGIRRALTSEPAGIGST